jgi:hypothetical protein
MHKIGLHLWRPHPFVFLLKIPAAMLSLILVVNARSQDGTRPSEPQSLSVLYYLDATTKLIPLESQLVRRKQKLHSVGFAGGEMMYAMDGHKSPLRLKATDKSNFVVRLKAGLDPVEAVQLFHIDVVDGSRVVPIENFNALGRVTKVTVTHAVIDFNAAIYGASSFKLVPLHALAAGEYCFLMKAGNQWPREVPGFCFGIDEP